MNTTQRLITTLLKAAVTGQAQPLPEGYSLEEAMPIIRKQGLASLAYEGAYLCGISRKDPLMQELFKLYYKILIHSERQLKKVEEVCRAFEENGIDYLPFKGCVLKAMYPRPELRPMGDADILIRFEQYPKIQAIMKNLGFVMAAETECELTWNHPALHLELHRSMFYPEVEERDLYHYFGDGWKLAMPVAKNRYEFGTEDSFLYIFTHFVKHYRSGGIGSRHVLDLWMYRNAYPEINEGILRAKLKELHLERFYDNTVHLMEVWFEGTAESAISEVMTERILGGGSFGKMRDRYLFSEMMKTKNNPGAKNGALLFLLRRVFPSLDTMRKRYNFVDKCPFLLPIAWIARGGKIFLFRRGHMKSIVDISGEMNAEMVEAHQDALRFVGLDFHG